MMITIVMLFAVVMVVTITYDYHDVVFDDAVMLAIVMVMMVMVVIVIMVRMRIKIVRIMRSMRMRRTLLRMRMLGMQ